MFFDGDALSCQQSQSQSQLTKGKQSGHVHLEWKLVHHETLQNILFSVLIQPMKHCSAWVCLFEYAILKKGEKIFQNGLLKESCLNTKKEHWLLVQKETSIWLQD